MKRFGELLDKTNSISIVPDKSVLEDHIQVKEPRAALLAFRDGTGTSDQVVKTAEGLLHDRKRRTGMESDRRVWDRAKAETSSMPNHAWLPRSPH